MVKLPLKPRPKRRFFDHGVKVKDLIDMDQLKSNEIKMGDKSLIIQGSGDKVKLSLRFGNTDRLIERRPSRYLIEVRRCEDDLIQNDFYRHLIRKTMKPTIWQKTKMFILGPDK